MSAGKLSFNSPLGAAVMNHKVNDIVNISSPDSTYAVKIIQITI
ncbi:GreA/GreB family elongation factor [Paucilactobacillus nenjiangensis]